MTERQREAHRLPYIEKERSIDLEKERMKK